MEIPVVGATPPMNEEKKASLFLAKTTAKTPGVHPLFLAATQLCPPALVFIKKLVY